MVRAPRSHGDGRASPGDLRSLGQGVVLEPTALIFHPENISLGDRVYVGHYSVLNGYHTGSLEVGPGTWIGPQTLLHGAGGLEIGSDVGVGPGVRILTSVHTDPGRDLPLLHGELRFAPVRVGDGSDLGTSCVILPGVTIGRGVQVGAGAVVTEDLPDFSVATGVPAKVRRVR